MGVCWQAVCHGLHERINPHAILDESGQGHYGARLEDIADGGNPFAAIVVFAMATRWRNFLPEMLGDDQSVNEEALKYYSDVAPVLVKQFNTLFGTDFKTRWVE